jgi:multisubunit Na+/H+ antiporter MnhB subunit
LLLVIRMLSWLIATIRRRLRRIPRPEPQPGIFGRLSRGARVASLCCLIFAALLGVVVLLASGESFWIFSSAATPFLRVIQLFALLTMVGAAVTIVAAIGSWRTAGERWWLPRVRLCRYRVSLPVAATALLRLTRWCRAVPGSWHLIGIE